MLGVSGMLGNSGDGGATATAAEARESGGSGGGSEVGGGVGPSSGGFSEEEKLRIEESDRNSGGNRWPRQETLALLQIRSDMDVAFRDSSLKGPLWEEVARKLAELGYHRSAKKCKEKFENVYKYHRRTKEGRSTKPEGKTYRFFDQLEALENQAPPFLPPQPPPQQQQQNQQPPRSQSQPVTSATPVAVAMPAMTHPPLSIPQFITVPSIQNLNPTTGSQTTTNPTPPNQLPPSSLPPPLMATPMSFSCQTAIPSSRLEIPADIASMSTSSSTSSDEEPEKRRNRKRKWGDFFQRLMSEVIEKQEQMQRKFLDTLERRERERVAREEAWRTQEMARMNREHELLVHERSVAAAKDAAVIQFLQKISDQQIPNAPQMQENNPTPPAPPPTQPPPQPSQPVSHPPPLPQPVLHPPPPPPPPAQPPQILTPTKGLEITKTDNGGGENFTPMSSSRWPKAEVEALIRLRTNMDTKYQENVPKGPLWEEISAAMRRIGYDRNAKRCKEKWENINKYFKKVKESNKKRPEDSKTCPYFQQLDELYKEKAKNENSNTSFNPNPNVFALKPENIPAVPIMVQPERQYRPEMGMEDDESQNIDDEEGDDDDDDDDEAGAYEVVPNKASNSVSTKIE